MVRLQIGAIDFLAQKLNMHHLRAETEGKRQGFDTDGVAYDIGHKTR